ncbi:MAG: DUF5615 family PIN-like protein [bacterium]
MKKPSAASIDRQLEAYEFLAEESLGKKLPRRLSENGFRVISQIEDLASGLSDPEVFAIAADRGLIILSKDWRTRYRPIEKAAIVGLKLAVFQLSSGNWNGEEMANAFINAKAVILRCLQREARPFVCRLNQKGEMTAFYSKGDLTERRESRSQRP